MAATHPKIAALDAAFRALEQDVNRWLRADRSNFDTNPMEDAISDAESAIAAMAVKIGRYYDHIDELHARKEWAA